MNARNLGVVFGRKFGKGHSQHRSQSHPFSCVAATLMRSSDPAREFADMAGKALSIEWMVENAPTVFQCPEKP
jgi:hypothetical protein